MSLFKRPGSRGMNRNGQAVNESRNSPAPTPSSDTATMLRPWIIEVDGRTVELRASGPYKARSANDQTDDWPAWYVTDSGGRRNVAGFGRGAVLCDREFAERVAAVANEKARR